MTLPTYVIESEKYLEYVDFAGFNGDALRELARDYPGYTADFVYKSIEPPAAEFESANVPLVDASIETRLKSEDFKTRALGGVTIIDRENYADFTVLHNASVGNMYWTSERILTRFDEWYLAIMGGGYIMMSMWGKSSDVYDLKGDDNERKILLVAGAAHAFSAGKREVLFFIDKTDYLSSGAAREIGFIEYGACYLFRTVLAK